MSETMTPIPWAVAAKRLLCREEAQSFDMAHLSRTENMPQVCEMPDGLLIEKRAQGGLPAWQIRIRTPLDQPAAFAYNLFGPSPPPDGEGAIPPYDREYFASFRGYVLRIVATHNVQMEIRVESANAFTTAVDFRVETHIVDGPPASRASTVDDDLILPPVPLENLEGWNHIGLVPPQGSYLDPQKFQFYLMSHSVPDDIPEWARGLTVESLSDHQVAGDRIAIRGQQQGNLRARVSPRLLTSFTGELQVTIAFVEFGIGMIPLLGSLYEFASAVYIQSTGRSWWGERRQLGWMDLIGIGALGFGLLGETANASRLFGRSIETFERVASNRSLMRSIARQIDPPLRAQLDITPPSRRQALAETAGEAAAGIMPPPRRRVVESVEADPRVYSTRGQEVLAQAAARAQAISRRTARNVGRMIDELDEQAFHIIADELLTESAEIRRGVLTAMTRTQVIEALLRANPETLSSILRQHERVRLLKVMSPNFRSISNELLNRGYLAHASKRQARGEADVSAIAWISKQRRGQYADELRRILGRQFALRIRSGAAHGLGSQLDDAALRAFTALQDEIVPYTELVRRRSEHATSIFDPGAFWDADHLLEKRFIHHLKAQLPDFDSGSLNALLVPKHQGILRRMQELSLDGLITYDHSTKTQLLRTLIPYGEAGQFSLQQWWDAHSFVYLQLPVPNTDRLLSALRQDFDRIADTLNESYTPRRVYNGLDLTPRDMVGRTGGFSPGRLL
jgi:hypothetical protein